LIELFFKIVLPVAMIGIVTLVGHRYGPAMAGVLGAVPAKAGPILLFLALEQGPLFAANSAAAALGGAAGGGVFCLAYARVCRRAGWPVAGAAAYGAFLAVWAVMLPVSAWGLWPAFAVALCLLVASRRLLPEAPPVAKRQSSVWADLPARMIAGAGMVVFVTTVGPHFGATISGMLTTIPTIAAVLALFTHAQEGPDRTVGAMRGMTHGLLGFASFLTVLSATLVPLGILAAFGLAFSVVLAVQLIELRAAYRGHVSLDEEAVPVAMEAAE
jgi:hypothetical protein